MPEFVFRKSEIPDGFTVVCVRDLKPGMRVPVTSETWATVNRTHTIGEEPGEVYTLIGEGPFGGRSAYMMKVEFKDHDPVYAHPFAVVLKTPKSDSGRLEPTSPTEIPTWTTAFAT